MSCPGCGGSNFVRYRSPKSVARFVIRRHTCRDCRRVFLSIQYVVDPITAEALLKFLPDDLPVEVMP